jgi:hypothetical protein
MKPEEHARKVTKIIAKAWMDEGFKARLLSDPMATLKEEGVEIPPGAPRGSEKPSQLQFRRDQQ